MKSRIASALAVLACIGMLSACSGKHHAGRDAGTTGTGAVQPVATSAAAPQPSAATGATAADGGADAGASDAVSDPDAALSSVDQQLSDLDGALKSADDQPSSDGDNG